MSGSPHGTADRGSGHRSESLGFKVLARECNFPHPHIAGHTSRPNMTRWLHHAGRACPPPRMRKTGRQSVDLLLLRQLSHTVRRLAPACGMRSRVSLPMPSSLLTPVGLVGAVSRPAVMRGPGRVGVTGAETSHCILQLGWLGLSMGRRGGGRRYKMA